MSTKKKIRVGLLIDDFLIPFWAFRMIENISSSSFAEVVLIVKKKSSSNKRSSFIRKIQKNYHLFFYKLYRKIEDNLFKITPNAFEYKDLKPLIKTSQVLEVTCIEKNFSDYIQENDIRQIKGLDVDVFVRLGFRILRGEILKASKFGVWSYHHGDNKVNRGGPAGFWEVFGRKREIGSVLQILTEDLDGGKVLYRSWSTVHRLLNHSLNIFYWKTSLFIPRKLKELFESGEHAFRQKLTSENEKLEFYSHPLFTAPRNSKFLVLFFSHYWDWLKLNVWKLFNFEQWILLYAFNKRGIATSVFTYKRLIPPRDRFWADPFVIYEEGKYYIFLEELIYKKQKGHLAVMEIDANGSYKLPTVILERSYHLSYPFIFKYEGEYYMIPESTENSTIELYHAVGFPFKWEFCMNLMENVSAVDTTLFIKDNKFWLFTCIKEIEGAAMSEELFLFCANELFTNTWESHPLNPVISDVKYARPAGRMFYHNGKLYRPSQDSSYKYGYSTVINEVLVLNEREYQECKVSEISPNWATDVKATHTLSFDQNLTVIDAAINRKKWFN
ncbi:hypothetical protein [Chryseolinea sp. H1M3-3]|uniref:glucosamine inositolphosphorylceramide transferase family protein n=1 Tax=Chryseolinea sp. H1M3-3 TaxID=3034144 RepID=UPI0023EBE9CC|nr:hypothetical protein [Chryseolinea sp. H1M3-3]